MIQHIGKTPKTSVLAKLFITVMSINKINVFLYKPFTFNKVGRYYKIEGGEEVTIVNYVLGAQRERLTPNDC